MIVFKMWINGKGERNNGWFLFGFIPLYTRHNISGYRPRGG